MKFLEYFFYSIIFLIPAHLVRFSVFGIPTNVLEVFVGILFLVLTILKVKSTIQNVKLLTTHYSLLTAGIIFLSLGLLFGVIVSPDIKTSLGAMKSWFIIPLIFFITARDILDTKEKKDAALWSLSFSGIAVAIVGFFYWIFGSVTFDGRLKAFYESPNMLAMYVAPALLIVAAALKEKLKTKNEKPQRKIKNFKFLIVVFSFSLLVFSLFLSRSLGAILAVFTVFLAYYLYTAFWNGRRKMQYILFFIIVFAGIALPFFSLFMNPWEMGRSSLASRLMVWQASVEMLKENWLFGIGPGMFQEQYLAAQKNYPPYLEWAVPHPHNIFLAIWLYGGLAGFLGFLLILFWIFSTRNKKSSVVSSLSLVVLYLLIHGAIDNTLWRQDMAMVFWLLAAVI